MEYQFKGSWLIIPVGKDLDHHRAEEMQKILNQIAKSRGIRHILFDFTETEFMDSSGVGMIISRYRQLTLVGGSVCVAGTTPLIERLFYVSGLHKIIRMYPEVEDVFHE